MLAFGWGKLGGTAGTVKKLWTNGGLGVEAKTMMYEEVVLPTALYGAETWGLRETKKKLNFLRWVVWGVCVD